MAMDELMITNTATDMPLHQILAMFSGTFPTGAFAFSHGIEQAIKDHLIADCDTFKQYLHNLVEQGSSWNDLLLLRASYFGQDTKELAVALASSQSRRKETEDQGFAFAHNINKIYGIHVDPAPLPVVVGQISKRLNLDIDRVSSAYLHSIISNWISIGIRLVPIGQTDGQIILHSLFPVMEQLVQRSKQADLDQLTSCGLLSEICAMRHRSAKTRICIT